MKRNKGSNSVIGWFFAGAGAVVISISAGLLPVEESLFNAPKWIVALSGFVFMVAGIMMILGEKSGFNNLLAAALLVAMGTIGGWVALFGAGDSFSGGLPFAPDSANISLARTMFGFGALICYLMSVYAARLHFKKIKSTIEHEYKSRF